MKRIATWIFTVLLLPAAGQAEEPAKGAAPPAAEARAEEPAPPAKRAEPAEEPSAKRAEPADEEQRGDKVMSGMSIVGNDEAPKSLVIVPWKSSEMAGAVDVSRSLDDSRQPVDPVVFERELDFYEIRAAAGESAP